MKSVTSQTASKSSLPAGGRLLAGAFEAVANPVDAGITRLFDHLFTWHQRVRDRQALDLLDSHMLHDIGLSRADVEQEVSKSFWQS
ncbi:MAG TPA: DUF1127 domain-containing protein [Candidatus Angelobacter sp.]|nr:DUF1127 domain-containing protein [Candidatus Angelobacter sp.]